MKLIESKAEYIPQEEGLDGIYKAIELAGRTAYHSQDKITPTSAKNFVDRMIKSKHGACLEHGTVYLKLPFSNLSVGATNTPKEKAQKLLNKYIDNKYTQVFAPDFYGDWLYATSNMRVLVENNWLDDLKYLCSPTEFHEKRYTMRFTCSRAIANELIRHRTMSFLQESTRYINYSKERHGGEITYIKPSWLEESEEEANSFLGLVMAGAELNEHGEKVYPFFESLVFAEKNYFVLLNKGFIPQQARDVLPNATKTELIMTGFSSDWRHVLDLRLFEKTGKVAPDMLDLMQKAQASMQEAGIWEDIMSKPSKFE
jgi:thymidylate synthase (FAD)